MNYKNLLYEIQRSHSLGPAAGSLLYPEDELYPVDLSTRTIKGPEFISVKDEHRAEIIYFILDRYYGNMDLSQTNCVIQYTTSDNKTRYYPVPFCDVHSIQEKMIIPWSVSSSATAADGPITYVIRFYLLSDAIPTGSDGNPDWENVPFTYSLSTLPAVSQILKSFDFSRENVAEEQFEVSKSGFFELMQTLNSAIENGRTYWIDV